MAKKRLATARNAMMAFLFPRMFAPSFVGMLLLQGVTFGLLYYAFSLFDIPKFHVISEPFEPRTRTSFWYLTNGMACYLVFWWAIGFALPRARWGPGDVLLRDQ